MPATDVSVCGRSATSFRFTPFFNSPLESNPDSFSTMNNIWVWVAEVVPMGVLIFFLFNERRQGKKRRERAPLNEKLLRSPGHSLSLRIDELWENASTWMMGTFAPSALFALVLLRPNTKEPIADITILSISGVAAAGCIVMAWRRLHALRPYRLGLLGEQAMAEQLQTLARDGYWIFHDLEVKEKTDKPWNIDHIAVGPAGVFAIETKTSSKRPTRNELPESHAVFDGTVIRFPWFTNRNAAIQVRQNGKWLANMLSNATGEKVTVQTIVALPGWFVPPHAESDVRVLNSKLIPGYITNAPANLSSKLITRIVHQLDQRCRDVEF